MKKKILYLLILFSVFTSKVRSQDVGITGIVSPVSSCNIGTDTIIATLFNFSPFPIGGTFTMQYTINGGPPVSENISTSLNASQSVDFAFATLSNFSIEGTYQVCVTVIFVGDINSANNTNCANVISDTSVIGGTISSSVSLVCSGSNTGTMNLSGQNNPITQWEFSINNGNPPWNPVVPANNTTTHTFNNLTSQTYFRVLIEGGFCPDDYSTPFIVNVDLPTNAGSISGSTAYCSTTNSGTLTSVGVVGTILDWETSTTGTFPGTSTGNSTSTLNYNNLTQTTYYKVIAQNGVCPPASSATAIIDILPASNGGTISGGGDYCLSNNNGLLTLNGYGGDSLYWIYSVDGGVNWNTISNYTDTYAFSNVNINTVYAVVVQFVGCSVDTSAYAFVNIIPDPIANAGIDDTIFIYDSSPLNASGGYFYDWSPSGSLSNANINNPVASPLVTTTYTVIVSDSIGCFDTDDVTIYVIDTTTAIPPPTDIIVSNFITLNNDGLNDVWNIPGIQLFNDTEVTVFNNQGQIVFNEKNYANTWAGTFNSDALPDGNYFYVVVVGDLSITKKGILTIISNR